MQRLHLMDVASRVALLLTAVRVLTAAAAFVRFPEQAGCLDGRLREYWEEHGGLAVFGFAAPAPIYEQNRDVNQRYESQWFERDQLELHPEDPAPCAVLPWSSRR